MTLIARPRRFGKTLNMSMLEKFFQSVCMDMPEYVAASALHKLSDVNGYWDEQAAFTRSLFNFTFKTNPHLERTVRPEGKGEAVV